MGCPFLFFVNTNTKSKSKRSIAGPTFLLKGSVLYCDDFKLGKRFVVHLKTTDAAFQVPCIAIILGCHSHIRMRLIQPITARSFLTKKKMLSIKTAGFPLKWDGNASFFKNALKIAANTSRLNQFFSSCSKPLLQSRTKCEAIDRLELTAYENFARGKLNWDFFQDFVHKTLNSFVAATSYSPNVSRKSFFSRIKVRWSWVCALSLLTNRNHLISWAPSYTFSNRKNAEQLSKAKNDNVSCYWQITMVTGVLTVSSASPFTQTFAMPDE